MIEGGVLQAWMLPYDPNIPLGNIWVEADIASAGSDAALDASLDRPNLFWGARRTEGTDRDLLAHLAGLGFRFYGLEADRARIAVIAATLPEEASIFQMGVMGARETPVVRLCLNDMGTETGLRWLAGIGWSGNVARLRGVLDRITPLCGEIALNIDILSDGVGPKLGLELYSAEKVFSIDPWLPLFDELSARGLARADKLKALADFPSFRRFRQIGAWNREPPVGYPLIATNLHHLKLVLAADATVETKAYLGVFRPVMDYSRTRGHEMEGGGGWR